METKINVPDVKIEIKTISITKSIVKQMRKLTHDQYMKLIKENPQCILGWFDGDTIFDWGGSCWVIIKAPGNNYFVFGAHPEMKSKVPQIFL